MAKRAKEPKEVIAVCSECSNATWQWKHEHIDLNGKPICVTCKHAEHWIIREMSYNKQCPYYRKGEPKNSVKPKGE